MLIKQHSRVKFLLLVTDVRPDTWQVASFIKKQQMQQQAPLFYKKTKVTPKPRHATRQHGIEIQWCHKRISDELVYRSADKRNR